MAMAKQVGDLGYPPDLEPAINEELAVLASIEAGYANELEQIEHSATPASIKGQLRLRRTAAREAHVFKLADLHERMLKATMYRGQTKH
jgi:hypothetical protein